MIGIDNGIEDSRVLSMSDSINIVAIDTVSGKLSVISVSRDTMADIDLYSSEGDYIDTERMQLAYAYSFGNNTVTGGTNTANALTKLFYGLPINAYFALNMDALTTINDAIGGVTLASSFRFTSPIDGRTIEKGEQVTLHGKEVEYYVRLRENDLTSNNERMQRQKEYISAFIDQIIPMVSKNPSLVTDLYNIVSVNSDSDLTLAKLTYLVSTLVPKLSSGADIEYLSLEGTTVEGEFAEFTPDDESILKTMLQAFYTEEKAAQ